MNSIYKHLKCDIFVIGNAICQICDIFFPVFGADLFFAVSFYY